MAVEEATQAEDQPTEDQNVEAPATGFVADNGDPQPAEGAEKDWESDSEEDDDDEEGEDSSDSDEA